MKSKWPHSIIVIGIWAIMFTYLGCAMAYQSTETTQDTSSINNSLYRYSGVLMLLMLSIYVLVNWRFVNKKTVLYRPLIYFSIFMAIGIAFSSSDLFSLYGLFNLASLTFIPFLTYSFGCILSKRCDKALIGVLVFAGIIYLSYSYFSVFQLAVFTFGSAVIWVATYPLTLLPLQTVCDTKYLRILRIVSIIIVFAVVVTCSKRSAAIALLLGLLLYFTIQKYVKGKGVIRMSLFLGGIILLMLYGIEYFAQYLDFNVLERFANITDDGGSGRNLIYKKVYDSFISSDLLSQLFGHGHQAVLQINYTTAHNDFLEVVYDYGILTLIPYLFLHIRLYKLCLESVKQKQEYAPTLCFSAFIFLVFSMISHVILYPTYLITTLTWGVTLGNVQNRIRQTT